MNEGYISYLKTKEYKQGDIINEKDIVVHKNFEDSINNVNEYEYNKKPYNYAYVSINNKPYIIHKNKFAVTNSVKIDKILTNDDIINIMISNDKTEDDLIKFLTNYKLNDYERQLFINSSYDNWLKIMYYQDGDENVYKNEKKHKGIYEARYKYIEKKEGL